MEHCLFCFLLFSPFLNTLDCSAAFPCGLPCSWQSGVHRLQEQIGKLQVSRNRWAKFTAKQGQPAGIAHSRGRLFGFLFPTHVLLWNKSRLPAHPSSGWSSWVVTVDELTTSFLPCWGKADRLKNWRIWMVSHGAALWLWVSIRNCLRLSMIHSYCEAHPGWEVDTISLSWAFSCFLCYYIFSNLAYSHFFLLPHPPTATRFLTSCYLFSNLLENIGEANCSHSWALSVITLKPAARSSQLW